MSDLKKVSRALISVSDKNGIVDFARALNALGVELLSTGARERRGAVRRGYFGYR